MILSLGSVFTGILTVQNFLVFGHEKHDFDCSYSYLKSLILTCAKKSVYYKIPCRFLSLGSHIWCNRFLLKLY